MSPTSFESKLLQYSTVAAAVLLAAGSAEAQIWNSGEINKLMPGGSTADTCQINYAGSPYLILKAVYSVANIKRFDADPAAWLKSYRTGTLAPGDLKHLYKSDVVSAAATVFTSNAGISAMIMSVSAHWGTDDRYIGVRIGEPGSYRYGWIRVNAPNSYNWLIKGWAFNTVIGDPITCDGVLPVELTSFTASLLGRTASLHWSTATEVNNYGFNIERNCMPEDMGSGPSVTEWETIGFVPGNGNSNSPKEYSFTDPNPPAGLAMYRLKQVDNDGAFEYSETVTIVVSAPKEFTLGQNYPNPFNPSTEIRYSIPEESVVSLTVFDMLGTEVASLVNTKQRQGTHTVHFDASSLPSGTYMYRLTAGDFTETKKLMIIK